MTKKTTKPYIIDCITYNGEIELLQIRLAVLNEHVDEFWVIWGEETYKGALKELIEEPQFKDFGKAADKVKIIKVPQKKSLKNPWHREFYQKAYIGELKKIWRSKKSRVYIFCSDLDEVWNPDLKSEIINDCDNSLIGFSKFYLDNFNFYINYKCMKGKEKNISGPFVLRAGSVASYLTRTELRLIAQFNGHTKPLNIRSSGWHWSYVSSDEKFIGKKIAAFSHEEPHVISSANASAEERIRKNKGLIEIEDEFWEVVNLKNLRIENCDLEFTDIEKYMLPNNDNEKIEGKIKNKKAEYGNYYINNHTIKNYYKTIKSFIRYRINSL